MTELQHYRTEFAAYHSALAEIAYRAHAGLPAISSLIAVRERYADLFSRAALSELAELSANTTATTTETAARHALRHAAQLVFVENASAEVTAERAACVAAVKVGWRDEKLSLAEAVARMSLENNREARRELAARYVAVAPACDDLRAAVIAARNAAAQIADGDANGFPVLLEKITRVDLTAFSAQAEKFLTRTNDLLRVAWHAHAGLDLNADTTLPATANDGDFIFWQRAAALDNYFPATRLLAAYTETLAELGVRVRQQTNVTLDAAARPQKQTVADVFPLAPPRDARLSFTLQNGMPFYRALLGATGATQFFAWISAETATRYPEFVFAADDAAQRGYEVLFADLLTEPVWLGAHLRLAPDSAQRLAAHLRLQQLIALRHDCAQFIGALAVNSAPDARAEHLREQFAAQMSDATGFRHGGALLLVTTDDNLLSSLNALRGALFAVALRERLRVRYGRAWWQSRKAGDELIDMWNTGARYGIEELAQLIDAGDINFDLLIETLAASFFSGDE